MSCLITSGYTKACDAPAGIRKLYFINYDEISTITRTGSEITALTLATNKKAYIYNVEREVTKAECNSIGTVINGSLGFEQKLSTKLHGFSKELQNQMELLAGGRVIVIAETNAGVYEVYFDDGGAKASVKRVNDAEFSGFNGYEIELSHKQKYGTATISATIVANLPV